MRESIQAWTEKSLEDSFVKVSGDLVCLNNGHATCNIT